MFRKCILSKNQDERVTCKPIEPLLAIPAWSVLATSRLETSPFFFLEIDDILKAANSF